MISRSATHITTLSQRGANMRRLQHRRRTAPPARFYCRTNGCTTYLQPDLLTGLATCPICGARRRID